MFSFKACQHPFDLKASEIADVPDTFKACAEKGNGYWLNSEGVCEYSFVDARFKGTYANETKDGETVSVNKGWTLTYLSQEKCGDEADHFTFVINGICDEDDKVGSFDEIVSDGTCSAHVDFTGKPACVFMTIKLAEIMEKVSGFIGAILIVFGILLAFFGSKFLF